VQIKVSNRTKNEAMTIDSIFHLGQDDTVYAEHRPIPLKLLDRPPSSPSRFDLKTRHFRSQSLYQMRPSIEPIPEPSKSPINLFAVVHRPPSQNHLKLPQKNAARASRFKSLSFQIQKTPPEALYNPPKPPRPQTVPTTPVTYEVKRGNKIYKVIVGYVSPYTSPLQRKELHLKTEKEVNVVMQEIKQQQEKQRASKPQVWLGLPPPSKLK
jgi:hypothetical protein